MADFFILVEYLFFLAFPLLFIYHKKGNHKFLFISSVAGAEVIIQGLLTVSMLPITIFLSEVVPSLDELEITKNIIFLISFLDIFKKYYVYFFWIFPVVLPFLIYRKYKIFHAQTQPIIQADCRFVLDSIFCILKQKVIGDRI